MTDARDRWTDWITIWQSEMAAMAADREVQEAVQRGIDLWAAQARLLAPKPPPDDPARSASALPPPRSPTAAAPPGEPERAPAGPGKSQPL